MALTLKAVVELEKKRKRTDNLMGDLLADSETQEFLKRKLAKMQAR